MDGGGRKGEEGRTGNGMPKSVIERTVGRGSMDKVVYTSKSTIERKRGPLRIAHLPGEAQPVSYSVHGAIAEHYKVDPQN